MSNKNKDISVCTVALEDIQEHLKEEGMWHIPFDDTWVVSGANLATKEQRALNRELGLHKLNKSKTQE